jgi:hypothetical protein
MATVPEVREYLGTLSTTLWDYGATFPVPSLYEYGAIEMGFALVAKLPGETSPKPAEIKLAEIWASLASGGLRRIEYEYDFIEYPLARRRAFHRHHPDWFAREFGVLVHEHCEEELGAPACAHYFGFPMDGFEAIRQFTALWGQDSPLGCAGLRCME